MFNDPEFKSLKSNVDGEIWIKDSNDNILPFNVAFSGLFIKYQNNLNSNFFYNKLTSNEISNYEIFYDSIFIQTEFGSCIDRYKIENNNIVSYDSKINFLYQKQNEISYWFDEQNHKVYIFCFLPDDQVKVINSQTSDTERWTFKQISINFNFYVFDIKTNTLKNLIDKKIKYWVGNEFLKWKTPPTINPNIKSKPLLSFNPDTKTFNVSFTIKEYVDSEFGIISINFKETKVLEVNNWIPWAEVMPFGYDPIPIDDTGFTQCGDLIEGEQGYLKYLVYLGINTGQVNFTYNAFSIPDKFIVIYDGTTYSTKYVGSIVYQNALLSLGIPLSDMDLTSGNGSFSFYKSNASPVYATVMVEAPLLNTGWNFRLACPDSLITPTPTPTPTPTINFTRTPTPTPTTTKTLTPSQTRTPSNTPPINIDEFKSVYIVVE